MKRIYPVVLIVLAIAMVAGCSTTSLMERSRTISVQGTGTVTVIPDTASFSITVSELAQTTAEAQQKTNEKIGTLLDMIKRAGVADSDIATAALSFSPEYQWKEDERVLVGQRVRQTLYVTVRSILSDDTLLPSLIDQMGTVSNISVSSIRFSKDDTSAAYEESRVLAMQKAMQKASDYAQTAHMELGEPINVSDYASNDYLEAPRSSVMKADAMMMAESFAPTELPAGKISISSTVSVVFELL